MVGWEGSGSFQSLFHISHWAQLPPVPQNDQMVLRTRGAHFWQFKECNSKRCWFHLSKKKISTSPRSWIKVHCLTLAYQHHSVLGCWGDRYFTRTLNSTSNNPFELRLWQTNWQSHHAMVIQLLAQNDTVILFWFLAHRTETTTAISPLKALCSLASTDLCFYSTTR